MEKRNYAKEMEKIIRQNGKQRPTVLLHSCCGPCSSSVLEYMTQFFHVTLLWYNPNLYPQEEFDRRFETQKEIIRKMGLEDSVKILALPWQSETYFTAVRGLEQEPEGGKRCEKCFQLRLRECAELAKDRQFDYFCTTLTVSRYKNAPLINAIGEQIAEETGAHWLPSDFKKNGGEMRSNQLSREYELYRQNYCGCIFSLQNRNEFEKAYRNK